MKVWNIESGTCLRKLEGHSNWVNYIVRLSNKNIVSCSDDKTIKVWNVNTGECLKTIEDSEENYYFTKLSNDKIISHSKEGISKLFDIKSGNCLKTFNCRWGLVFF